MPPPSSDNILRGRLVSKRAANGPHLLICFPCGWHHTPLEFCAKQNSREDSARKADADRMELPSSFIALRRVIFTR
jgi:hypothetical protein